MKAIKLTNKIRKAVFPVAGFGTRFLPATKAIPKELLPILDKPVIQYAAEEAIRAGIDTLIFVTGRNKRAIEDHFDANFELEYALEQKGKYEAAQMVRSLLPKQIECIFVRQPQALGLGHAVACAQRAVGDEAFSGLLADDFIVSNHDGAVADLVRGFELSGKSQLCLMEVEGDAIANHGVAEMADDQKTVKTLIEKPTPEAAPSNLASIGRYVLTPDVFDILKNIQKGSGQEYQLADAINIMAQKNAVEAQFLNGSRFDCGTIHGFGHANYHVAKERGIIVHDEK